MDKQKTESRITGGSEINSGAQRQGWESNPGGMLEGEVGNKWRLQELNGGWEINAPARAGVEQVGATK